MRYLQLGTSDLKVSEICLGTMTWGQQNTEADAHAQLDYALSRGVNFIDAAEMYPVPPKGETQGRTETYLGTWLKRQRRDRLIVATKITGPGRGFDWVRGGELAINARNVQAAVDGSLRRLQTDYIDLYQIHWPAGSWGSRKVQIEETMRALNDLKSQGKIRAIGVSNFSANELKEAARYGRIDSLQPPYSLFWRQVEKDALPYCRENGITALAYSPMAQGILAGRFGAEPHFEKGDHRRGHRLFQPAMYGSVQKAVEDLKPIAQRSGISLAQLALAWVISRPNTCAIAGARNAVQAVENARAMKAVLSAADLAEIVAVGRTVTDRLDDNPVQWTA
jgi:aryl-alcohol dehydrogenase-like predicted oxidoreductase